MLVYLACLLVSDIELAFGGDVMFGRYNKVGFKQSEGLFDKDVAAALKSDFTMVNLETPVDPAMAQTQKRPGKNRFGAKPETIATLLAANIHAVGMANNHAYDLGPDAMTASSGHIRDKGLLTFGVPAPATVTEERIACEEVALPNMPKACLIAVAGKSNTPNVPKAWPKVPYTRMWKLKSVLPPIVREAKKQYPLVIVFIHWGEEYRDHPGADQKRIAHALVDAGAKLVIGHHPHVVQGVERYKGALIAYSLGNLLFDRSRANTRDGVVLRIGMSSRMDVSSVKMIPTRIVHKPNAVTLLRGKTADKPLARMQRLSKVLGTKMERVDDTLVFGGVLVARKSP